MSLRIRTSPLLALIAAVPGAAQDGAPRAGIAGLAGFAARSEVRFEGEDVPPHALEAIYVFPDRARWSLSARLSDTAPRQLSFRLGEQAWFVEPESIASEELEAADRDAFVLQLELRRALLFWPDGFSWSAPEGGARTAPVVLGAGDGAREIGRLHAELGADGRPTRIRAVAPEGSSEWSSESLFVDEWLEQDGRRWPKRMRLEHDDRPVWRETLLELETDLSYSDLFFRPPDRRELGPLPGDAAGVFATDLRACTFKARAIDSGDSWDEWQALARSWIEAEARALEARGLALDPVPTFELGSTGRPTRCLLRLRERALPPPEGWTTIGDRPGLALVLARTADLDAAHLAALARAVPRGSRAEAPYARLVGTSLQVYLPLGAEPPGR